MEETLSKVNPEIEGIIRIAQAYARDNVNDKIEPSHLFKALLHKEAGLVPFIEKELGQDYYYLLDWADMRIKMEKKSTRPNADISFSELVLEVIAEAENISEKVGEDEVTPKMLLASIVTPGVGFTFEQLKTMPLTADEVLTKLSSSSKNSGSRGIGNGLVDVGRGGQSGKLLSKDYGSSSKKNVNKFCYCLNDKISNNEFDPIIGFDKELSEIFDILGRRTKSNILITGESGVGKTSLVRAFAQAIVNGVVPSYIENASVYELDLTALGMEVSFKGEIEGRMKKLLDEIQQQGNVILVIDGFDRLMDKQNMLSGCIGVLKNKLNNGLLTICTSSIDGYTKNIETDKEMVGKFERISLDEPSEEYAKHILDHCVVQYEQFHGLKVNPEVTQTAIRLAKRYFSEKHLPESALDMIDRTMALIKSTNDMAAKDLELISKRLSIIKDSDKSEALKKDEIKWLNYQIVNRISPIVLGETELKEIDSFGTYQDALDYIKQLLEDLKKKASETIAQMQPSHLLAVVAQKTGIPMGNIQSKERDRLVNAESILKKRVVGQDHAIKIVLDSIYESRSGLNKKGQPMGSFFFLGPTGTGKTELAKSLADFLFQDETAILRFDMSEYKEEHSVALLYGAPPGYVGYEEGGLLVNQIRQKPYSVVLFDEIEKAHRSVFDLFLQILDEGKLHDRLGRVGDFSNALILFTSNIGSQYIFDSFARGEIPTHNNMLDEMQGHFRPEFLARLTEIVPFSPINEKIVLMIFNIHLKGLLKSLQEQKITLNVTDEAKQQIAMRGFNAQYGARPILGIIRKEIRRPLSKMIISGELKPGQTVSLSLDDEKNLKWEIQ